MKRSVWRLLFISAAFFHLHIISAEAQDLINHFQYWFNPSWYNPSFYGQNGYSTVFFNYRKQWVGINDSPETISASFQMPVHDKVGIGIDVQNFATVLHNSMSLKVGASYNVSFGNENNVAFGLSFGIANEQLDLDPEQYQNDPAVLNLEPNTFKPEGQFGLNYSYKALRVDFSLPTLFNSETASENKWKNPSTNVFERMVVSANYDFSLKDDLFSIRPYIVYIKRNSDSYNLDMLALLDYKDSFWFGAGYRLDNNAFISVGSDYKRASFSYGYEFASEGIGNGSHEIQLKFKFGRRRFRKSEDVAVKEENNLLVNYISDTTKVLDVQVPKEKFISESSGSNFDELSRGYFLITGVFANLRGAEKFGYTMTDLGFNWSLGYSTNEELYFIYIIRSFLKNNFYSAYRNAKDQLGTTEHFVLVVQ